MQAYCLDLDRVRTGDAACDWLQQLREKTWAMQPAIAELAAFLQDHLGLSCDCLQQVLNLGTVAVKTRIRCPHSGTHER